MEYDGHVVVDSLGIPNVERDRVVGRARVSWVRWRRARDVGIVEGKGEVDGVDDKGVPSICTSHELGRS